MPFLLMLAALQDRDEVEAARRTFTPPVTRALLEGRIPAPEGFDDAMAKRIGRERFESIRAGRQSVGGLDNDEAALALVALGVNPESLKAPPDAGGGPHERRELSVRATGATYKAAAGGTSGFFKTGQDADLVLSAIGFNDAGGPLLFNHPMGIAGDDDHLLLADTYNNRVLVWSRLPTGNEPPDLVLGQKDFTTNDSGAGRDQMNWPVNVATDGIRVVVADTENFRLLVWTAFPTRSGQPADLVIRGADRKGGLKVTKSRFIWPWGVWTDGTKLAVTSTMGGGLLIWNEFPTKDDQPADLVLTGGGHLGTPRTITSDGRSLVVGDHNPKAPGAKGSGTYFWRTFPTSDEAPYDFFMGSPTGGHSGTWLRGTAMPDGRWILFAETMHVWDAFPRDEKDRPDLSIRGFDFRGGDHVGSVPAGGRLYICTGNLNKIVVYNEMPARADQRPDFAIGAPDLETNTLDTHFIISNPVPASNGRSLFVSSDFDRRLYVWKQRPDESAAAPDYVYDLPSGPTGIAVWKETLALAGHQTVMLWKRLPLAGEKPDVTIEERIGSVKFDTLRGVAIDDRYFYLSDFGTGKVHVWEGIPTPDAEPAFSLDFEGVGRISSDGTWLAVAPYVNQSIHLYRVDELGPDARPNIVGPNFDGGRFNQVPSAQVSGGRLFVAEAAGSKVHVWKSVEDAIAGRRADVLLGAASFDDMAPEQARDKVHYSWAVCFDGDYLWVGETKFSERLLRFSPSP